MNSHMITNKAYFSISYPKTKAWMFNIYSINIYKHQYIAITTNIHFFLSFMGCTYWFTLATKGEPPSDSSK